MSIYNNLYFYHSEQTQKPNLSKGYNCKKKHDMLYYSYKKATAHKGLTSLNQDRKPPYSPVKVSRVVFLCFYH